MIIKYYIYIRYVFVALFDCLIVWFFSLVLGLRHRWFESIVRVLCVLKNPKMELVIKKVGETFLYICDLIIVCCVVFSKQVDLASVRGFGVEVEFGFGF